MKINKTTEVIFIIIFITVICLFLVRLGIGIERKHPVIQESIVYTDIGFLKDNEMLDHWYLSNRSVSIEIDDIEKDFYRWSNEDYMEEARQWLIDYKHCFKETKLR